MEVSETADTRQTDSVFRQPKGLPPKGPANQGGYLSPQTSPRPHRNSNIERQQGSKYETGKMPSSSPFDFSPKRNENANARLVHCTTHETSITSPKQGESDPPKSLKRKSGDLDDFMSDPRISSFLSHMQSPQQTPRTVSPPNQASTSVAVEDDKESEQHYNNLNKSILGGSSNSFEVIQNGSNFVIRLKKSDDQSPQTVVIKTPTASLPTTTHNNSTLNTVLQNISTSTGAHIKIVKPIPQSDIHRLMQQHTSRDEHKRQLHDQTQPSPRPNQIIASQPHRQTSVGTSRVPQATSVQSAKQAQFTVIGNPPSQQESQLHERNPSLRILRQWFYTHLHYPFPSDDEKLELMMQTNFSLGQINSWFAGARSRFQAKMDTLHQQQTVMAAQMLFTSSLPGGLTQ